jgi:hypothetical protein
MAGRNLPSSCTASYSVNHLARPWSKLLPREAVPAPRSLVSRRRSGRRWMAAPGTRTGGLSRGLDPRYRFLVAGAEEAGETACKKGNHGRTAPWELS